MAAAGRVRATVEPGPNYIFHLLAVARIGFDSQYPDRHAGSVKDRDLETLRCHGRLLRFGNGAFSDLTFLAVFFPAYLSLDSPDSIDDYFSTLSGGLREGDCSGFVDRYADGLARQRLWTHDVDHRWVLENHRSHIEAIEQLGEVYARNYEGFKRDIWPETQLALLGVAGEINPLLNDQDLIGAWETLTGEEFLLDPFDAVLCAANEGGPDANSLGYERTLFSHERPLGQLLEWIAHEVGTHILFGILKSLWAERRSGGRLYWAYENLARHYNSLLLGRDVSYGMAEDDVWEGIYRDIHTRLPAASPERLLREALDVVESSGR